MKSASFLSEMSTVNSDPNNSGGGQAPTFGRDKDVLETTSGSIASVPSGSSSMLRRGKGSMFKGIKTSSKFANSRKAGIGETEEEMLDEILGFQISRTPQQKPRTSGTPLSQIRQQVQTDPNMQGRPENQTLFHGPEEYQKYIKKNKLQNKLVAAEGEVTDLGKEYGAPAPAKKQRSSDPSDHNPYPFSREDDEDYFREIFRKKREAAANKGVVKEFAAPGGDDGGPNEDEILFRLAKQWWLGNEQDMIRAERTLASMGWEIGEDEGSYDDGGVFVVRAGDVNGRSYQSWPHEELVMDEGMWDNIKKSFTPDPNWQKRASQQAGHMAQGAVAGGAHGHAVGHAMTDVGVAEGSNSEYDDEAGMADNNIETMKRAVNGLDSLIHTGDNLPEWCQEKIAVAKSMLVTVWDYMASEEGNVKEGEVTKTSTGLKHHGDFPDYPREKGVEFQKDSNRLNKSMTGRLDKAFDVHWEKGPNRQVTGDQTGISEEMLRDKLQKELLDFFEKGRPKDLSNKPKDKEIQKKEKK